MRSAFPIPGIFRALNSWLILSLACSNGSSKGNEINAFNLCTRIHCDDCSSNEFLKCSNGAVSNSCGDLCGCCHSCVQFRDFGESCGSQLAVRSNVNFEDSTSRVTILATTSCGKNLICKNFVCERLHDRANVENYNVEFNDLRTNLITIEDPREIKINVNDNDVLKRKIDLSTFTASTASPWPVTFAKNKISSQNTMQQDAVSSSNIFIDPSLHLINLLVAEREFQLIYGRDPLKDFVLLIESIDKNQKNSTINEYEAKILYQRLKDSQQFVSNNGESSSDDNDIGSSSVSLPIIDQSKNKNQLFIETLRDSRVMAFLRNFVQRPRSLKISKSRSSLRKFRKKRESDETDEKSKDLQAEDRSSEIQGEIDEKTSEEYGEISVHDTESKIPRRMDDFDRWLSARKVKTNPEEKSRSVETPDNDEYESEINIHINGVPRITNFDPEGIETREKIGKDAKIDVKLDEGHGNYDDLEIFDSNANTDIAKIFTTEDKKNLSNFSTYEIPEYRKNDENNSVENVTEYDWSNFNEKPQFFDNNYEFTFPENPVTLESDYYRDVDIIVNDNVEKIKAQLDRIETRSIVIENAIFDMIEKIDIDERQKNIENKETKIENFRITEPEEFNQFFDNYGKRKIVDFYDENSTRVRDSSENRENEDFTINKHVRLRKFVPNRRNHRWRTIKIQPNLSQVPMISKIEKRRPNRSERNKIIEPKVFPHRDKVTRVWDETDRRRQLSLPRRSSLMKFFKDLPKFPGQRKLPILLSSRDVNEANFFNSRHDDPRLFSRQQSSPEVASDSSQQRTIWPLNLVLNRAVTADRSDRKTEEQIRIHGRNIKPNDPLVEESIILLETQIPRSVRPLDSMINDDRTGESSVKFVTRYRNDDDRKNWENEESLVNLFVVDGENSKFEMTSAKSRIPESLVLPLENFNDKTSRQEIREVDDSYSIFPVYLDYAEGSKAKDEKIEASVESEMAGTSIIRGKDGSNDSRTNRKKRDAMNDFSQTQKFEDNVKNPGLPSVKVLYSSIDDSSSSTSQEVESRSIPSFRSDRRKLFTSQQSSVSGMKNLSKKRMARSVRMVDWLRAAQEYNERLRQVRNAAIKTWLASREELADANLTNVKLFTSEVPSYLERYKSTNFHENYDSSVDDNNHDYTAVINESEDPMADTSEILMDIIAEDSLPRENVYEPETSENTDVQYSQVSSSSVPRKFTIITNGNSTIRIEQMSNNDDDTKWLEDHVAEGSTESETTREHPIAMSENDYFDHMYESFDADDENFDYEDSNSMMSGWLDQIDIIESSSVEIPDKDKESRVNSNVEEQEDPSSRFKRDTPLFLFKVKGNPNHDVLVWPSNWRYLIDRHLRLNRSGETPPRMTDRTNYSRLGKIDSKVPSSASLRTSIDENSRYHEDEIPSSSKIREEKIGKDSRMDLDAERRLQKSFDHRSRQSRRKNGSYRSNIGNYK